MNDTWKRAITLILVIGVIVYFFVKDDFANSRATLDKGREYYSSAKSYISSESEASESNKDAEPAASPRAKGADQEKS